MRYRYMVQLPTSWKRQSGVVLTRRRWRRWQQERRAHEHVARRYNTQFDFQLLIKNYDNFMLPCIVIVWCTDLLNFMFVHVLIGSVTAICIVGWLHHYNYDGTDFVSVVTCVVVFLHYIIYVYFTYNFVATARNKISIYLSIYIYKGG